MADDPTATAAVRPLDPAATTRAIKQAQRCLDEAQKHLAQHRYDTAVVLAECAVTWIKAVLPDAALTALPPKYEPAQNYDDAFHVSEVDGGRTVAVCPTWEDCLLVSTALNTLAAVYPWAVPDAT